MLPSLSGLSVNRQSCRRTPLVSPKNWLGNPRLKCEVFFLARLLNTYRWYSPFSGFVVEVILKKRFKLDRKLGDFLVDATLLTSRGPRREAVFGTYSLCCPPTI